MEKETQFNLMVDACNLGKLMTNHVKRWLINVLIHDVKDAIRFME